MAQSFVKRVENEANKIITQWIKSIDIAKETGNIDIGIAPELGVAACLCVIEKMMIVWRERSAIDSFEAALKDIKNFYYRILSIT